MKRLSPTDRAKYLAARRAADLVEPGMKVGLGTGSTAAWLVRGLGRRVAEEGLRFTAVPTSARTGDLARKLGIEVVDFGAARWLDLTIDGADEVDPDLSLIKGGGGAHLMEKIVATASDRMVVIADAGKEVETLGAFPLPVEVIPFGLEVTAGLIGEMLARQDVGARETTLRMQDGAPFETDCGNRILDLHLGRIGDAAELAQALNQIPGVVENGLFVGICDATVIAHPDGRVVLRDPARGLHEESHGDPEAADDLLAQMPG